MNQEMEDGIKKVTMAGVGMAASVAEKTKDVIEKYSAKGEQVIKQNCDTSNHLQQKLNQFAKEPVESVKNTMDAAKEKAEDVLESAKNKFTNL